MKASEAVILWSPDLYARTPELRGVVHVRKFGHYDDAAHGDLYRAHFYKAGACMTDIRRATGNAALCYLFIQFNTMVVRDGIDPIVAHNALMGIEEYAAAVSPEIAKKLTPRIMRTPTETNAEPVNQ